MAWHQKRKCFFVSASFGFCPWETACLFFTCILWFYFKKTFAVREWISHTGLLAYSYTPWPPWPHPGECFCPALSWHSDRGLTLPPLTGKVCIVIINSWSLDISGCMLQISHYTGACDGAENADLKAFSLQLALHPDPLHSQGLLGPSSKAKELLFCVWFLKAVSTYPPWKRESLGMGVGYKRTLGMNAASSPPPQTLGFCISTLSSLLIFYDYSK